MCKGFELELLQQPSLKKEQALVMSRQRHSGAVYRVLSTQRQSGVLMAQPAAKYTQTEWCRI